MGGARCSYRNCTQKSDQVTHMFHYPVFDKVRCHQWITNAQKLNFLELKLSQLKNRLICQHHFTDDCFMNSLKKKLKNTAIPTLNGPYCTPSHSELAKEEADSEKELPINIEDIENEFLPRTEKHAHLSVKYGDFLTNDISDNITLGPKNKSTSIVVKDTGIIFNRFSVPSNFTGLTKINLVPNKGVREKIARLVADPKIDLPQPVSTQQLIPVIYHEPNLLDQATPKKPKHMTPTTQTVTRLSNQLTVQKQVQPIQQNEAISSTIPPTKRVKIISQKSISEPLKICKGEFQPVSPSIVINVPRKKHTSCVEVNGQEVPTILMDNVSQSIFRQQINNNGREIMPQVDKFSQKMPSTNLGISRDKIEDVKPIENIDTVIREDQLKEKGEVTHNHHVLSPTSGEWTMFSMTEQPVLSYITLPQAPVSVNNTSYIHTMSEAGTGLQNNYKPVSEQLPPKTSSLKQSQPSMVQTTATPDLPINTENEDSEKQMAMKTSPTKYVIPPEKQAEIDEKRKYNMKLRDIIDSCLNNIDEEPEAVKLNAIRKKELHNMKVGQHLANVSKQDNNIAYLEARLQRLEDTLLNKIDQNSQKITDLKKSLKLNTVKKAVSTQTYQTAEVNKKNLYQQISQYLSPSANCLIYEELFINKWVAKTRESPRKRRRVI